MWRNFSFLVGGKLVSEMPKGVVPEAICFTTREARQYLMPLCEITYKLTYEEAVKVADETKLCGVSCSLMPVLDLWAFMERLKDFNEIRERLGLRAIPTTGVRFWAEKKNMDRSCSFVTIVQGRVSSKYSNGNVKIGACLPALALDRLHRLSLENFEQNDDDRRVRQLLHQAVTTQEQRRRNLGVELA